MQPAPFTPDTVARIRSLAATNTVVHIAADLNWDAERVLRVARKFGIDVRGNASESVLPPQPKPRPVVIETVSGRPSRRKTTVLRHYEFTACMALDEIAIALPPRQRQVFRLLAEFIGDIVPGPDIANEIGCGARSVGHLMDLLRLKLRNTRWTIETSRNRYSGYRLVTQSGRVD